MSLVHHFNIQVAERLGVNAAILATNVQFWCAKNEANESERHFHEGRYWTFNSVSALEKLFPYLSAEQIRYALKKCVDDGLLIDGNFNKEKRDRTKWYSYNGHEWALENLSEMHLGNLPNAIGSHSQMPFGEIPKPLPDTNPDNKPNSKLSAQARTSLVRGLARLSGGGASARSIDLLLSEAEAFDGYRVLVRAAYMFDRLDHDLSSHLKAINLKITKDESEMMLSHQNQNEKEPGA